MTEAAPLVAVFDEWVPVTSTLLRRDLNRASLGRVVGVTSGLRFAVPLVDATSGAAFVRMCGPAPGVLPLPSDQRRNTVFLTEFIGSLFRFHVAVKQGLR